MVLGGALATCGDPRALNRCQLPRAQCGPLRDGARASRSLPCQVLLSIESMCPPAAPRLGDCCMSGTCELRRAKIASRARAAAERWAQ
jgi:hypothetical protein